MANSRLITSFKLYDGTGAQPANDTLRVTHSILGTVLVTLTSSADGTEYWHSDDGTSNDFLEELRSKISAAYAGARVWAVDINGVGHTTPNTSQGRIRVAVNSGSFDFVMGHATSTIDPRILGWGEGEGTQSSFGSVLFSDREHRYGWYPQLYAVEDLLEFGLDNAVVHSTSGAVDGQPWQEFEEMVLTFDIVAAALARIHAAMDSTRAALAEMETTTTTTPQINGSFERWVLDLASDTDKAWRYYADLTDTAVFKGPFRFRKGSILWRKPLGRPSRMKQKAGEVWTLVVDGRTAV